MNSLFFSLVLLGLSGAPIFSGEELLFLTVLLTVLFLLLLILRPFINVPRPLRNVLLK